MLVKAKTLIHFVIMISECSSEQAVLVHYFPL